MTRRPRRRPATPAPLPQRLGIDPVHLKIPHAAPNTLRNDGHGPRGQDAEHGPCGPDAAPHDGHGPRGQDTGPDAAHGPRRRNTAPHDGHGPRGQDTGPDAAHGPRRRNSAPDDGHTPHGRDAGANSASDSAPDAAYGPAGCPDSTVRGYLLGRLAAAGPGVIDRMFREGAFVVADGTSLAPDAPCTPGLEIWFHRDLPAEPPVPFPLPVLYRDAHILVADKPHFLATTPRGRHVTETALARLRRELDLPELSPAHRLDRLTAGLVLFVVRPESRGAYQTLFRDRQVHKEYEALAPYDPSLTLPRTVRSRIEKAPGIVAAREIPGEPNSESRIELVSHEGNVGRYRLTPHTGRTHQLRVHMNALGIPILGDPYFPHLTDPPPDDFSRPLQLLARTLSFTDPFTHTPHHFTTHRTLP